MNTIRNHPASSFATVLPILAGLLSTPAAAPLFKSTPGARCDLVSAAVADTASCIDVSSLDGTTLLVPARTTRISTRGLILCGRAEQTTDPMDIVHVVDQSNSMLPNSIAVTGSDTLAFYDCGSPFIDANTPTTTYHGVPVFVIPSAMAASAKAACNEAGDPTSIRDQLVKDAIVQQAKLSPGSEAAWIPFATLVKKRYMVDLSNAAATTALLQTIQNYQWGGTSYGGPIAWARLLLNGGTSTTATAAMPGSKNPRKAIFMISDGEPTDTLAYLRDLQANATVKDSLGNTWTTTGAPTPPIYGFLLSESNRSGKVLETLAKATGGQFFQIPPSRPDSLKRTLSRILGTLMGSGRPDSLRITNSTNGQVSNGSSGGKEAGGFRFRLDSIVGLVPGRNVLDLRFVLAGVKDSIVTARWTIEVADPAGSFSQQGTDSILLADCHDASRLRLAPQKDTTRTFADERDTVLRLTLETRVENQTSHAVSFETSVSGDVGIQPLGWNPRPSADRASTATGIVWSPSTATVVGDAVVQTGAGPDTLRALFRAPRDPRDSATAILPLHRIALPILRFLQDTSSAIYGSLDLEVVDASRVPDSLLATVVSRPGDTAVVVLRRMTGSVFRGAVTFRQGAAAVRSDAIVQTGPYRQSSPLDTIVASYSGAADDALLARPVPRLRFLDMGGLPCDSLPGATLDPGGATTFRVGLFIGSELIPWPDSVSLSAPSWLSVAPGGRLSNGIFQVQAKAIGTGSDGRIRILHVGPGDTLVFAPIRVSAYRIRFRHADGSVGDTLSIVARVRDTATVLVELWSRDTLCTTCTGRLRVAPSSPSLAATSPSGFALASGRTAIGLSSTLPLAGASLLIALDSLDATGSVSPIHVLAPAPDSALLLDADGDGALDRIRVHLGTPWTPAATFAFAWPDALHPLSLAGATFLANGDSTILDILPAGPGSIGTTAWAGGIALPGSWSPAPGIASSSFPAHERVPAIPLSARIGRGPGVDTLLIRSSEPIDARILANPGALALRHGAPASLLATSDARWDSASATLMLLYPSSAIDSIVAPGDSVRFSSILPDRLGNVPGNIAPHVEVAGIDRAPESAAMLDLDADGRADHVRLRFARVPRVVDSFAFAWSDGAGGVALRTTGAASAATDPSGRILTFTIAPYPYGATACPPSGCGSLGSMAASRWPAVPPVRFSITDSVPPAILDARFLFGAAAGSSDTLVATASEPVSAAVGAEWIRWGRPSRDPLGAAIARSGQSSDSVTFALLLDPSIEGSIQDSVRIAAAPSGGVEDRGHVAPGAVAPWVPLRVGPVPSHLRVALHPGFLELGDWEIPRTEPALQILVRRDASEPWRALDGSPLPQDPGHYLGILLETNIAVERGAAFLYDNMATSLGQLDLSVLGTASTLGTLPTTTRGDYQAWIVWNGRTRSGSLAASGAYPMRVVAWDLAGTRLAYNAIHILGWKRSIGP